MHDLWWVFAFCAGLMTAMFVFSNQVFRLKGSMVMIYRGIGTALCLLPFSLLFTAPNNAYFYYLCIGNGLLIAFLDNRVINAAKTFGAENAAMLQPLSVVFEFFVWFFFVPQLFINLSTNPLRLSLILLALFCLAFSIFMVKKDKVTKKAFFYLLPAMLSVMVIDVQCKILMSIDTALLPAAIFYYSMITSFIAGSINAVIYFKNGNKIGEVLKPRNIMFVGFPIILLMISIYIFKNCSLHYVENPAYTMAILNLYPLWVAGANHIYNKYFRHIPYPQPNRKALLLITAAVITLILCVN